MFVTFCAVVCTTCLLPVKALVFLFSELFLFLLVDSCPYISAKCLVFPLFFFSYILLCFADPICPFLVLNTARFKQSKTYLNPSSGLEPKNQSSTNVVSSARASTFPDEWTYSMNQMSHKPDNMLTMSGELIDSFFANISDESWFDEIKDGQTAEDSSVPAHIGRTNRACQTESYSKSDKYIQVNMATAVDFQLRDRLTETSVKHGRNVKDVRHEYGTGNTENDIPYILPEVSNKPLTNGKLFVVPISVALDTSPTVCVAVHSPIMSVKQIQTSRNATSRMPLEEYLPYYDIKGTYCIGNGLPSRDSLQNSICKVTSLLLSEGSRSIPSLSAEITKGVSVSSIATSNQVQMQSLKNICLVSTTISHQEKVQSSIHSNLPNMLNSSGFVLRLPHSPQIFSSEKGMQLSFSTSAIFSMPWSVNSSAFYTAVPTFQLSSPTSDTSSKSRFCYGQCLADKFVEPVSAPGSGCLGRIPSSEGGKQSMDTDSWQVFHFNPPQIVEDIVMEERAHTLPSSPVVPSEGCFNLPSPGRPGRDLKVKLPVAKIEMSQSSREGSPIYDRMPKSVLKTKTKEMVDAFGSASMTEKNGTNCSSGHLATVTSCMADPVRAPSASSLFGGLKNFAEQNVMGVNACNASAKETAQKAGCEYIATNKVVASTRLCCNLLAESKGVTNLESIATSVSLVPQIKRILASSVTVERYPSVMGLICTAAANKPIFSPDVFVFTGNTAKPSSFESITDSKNKVTKESVTTGISKKQSSFVSAFSGKPTTAFSAKSKSCKVESSSSRLMSSSGSSSSDCSLDTSSSDSDSSVSSANSLSSSDSDTDCSDSENTGTCSQQAQQTGLTDTGPHSMDEDVATEGCDMKSFASSCSKTGNRSWNAVPYYRKNSQDISICTGVVLTDVCFLCLQSLSILN